MLGKKIELWIFPSADRSRLIKNSGLITGDCYDNSRKRRRLLKTATSKDGNKLMRGWWHIKSCRYLTVATSPDDIFASLVSWNIHRSNYRFTVPDGNVARFRSPLHMLSVKFSWLSYTVTLSIFRCLQQRNTLPFTLPTRKQGTTI